MTKRCTCAILALCMGVLSASAAAQTVISNPQDVAAHIENSFDLRRAEENTHRAEVALSRITSPFYYPEVNSSIQYKDDHQLPMSPFLSARRQDVFWEAYLESRLPYGVTLAAGENMLRSNFSQASPANPLLPYPATYFQPQFFLRATLDLTRNFIGGEIRRQIRYAENDVKAAQIQERLAKHQLTVTALSMYYQIPTLLAIRSDSADVVTEYKTLEKSLSSKVNRYLAEKSDLYNIQNAIATQGALIEQADRTVDDIKHALALVLGDASLKVESSVSIEAIEHAISSCEDTVLTTNYATSLSEEVEYHKLAIEKADEQVKYYKHDALPSLDLVSSVSTTGTDDKYGPALKKQWTFKYPIYEVGAFLHWRTSPKVKKTAREGALMRQQTTYINAEQREQEQRMALARTQQNIETLRAKQESLASAVEASKKEIADLRRQYGNGRLTLFQLIEQRANLLQANIRQKAVTQERLTNLSDSLQFFDRVICELYAQKPQVAP